MKQIPFESHSKLPVIVHYTTSNELWGSDFETGSSLKEETLRLNGMAGVTATPGRKTP